MVLVTHRRLLNYELSIMNSKGPDDANDFDTLVALFLVQSSSYSKRSDHSIGVENREGVVFIIQVRKLRSPFNIS